jgi:hypothetical protein
VRILLAPLLALVVAVPALADEPEPYVRSCSSSAFGDLGRGWRENAVIAGHLAFVGLGGPRRSGELDPVAPGRANPLKVLVVVDPNAAPTLTIARASRRNAALGYNAIRHDGQGKGVLLADGTTSVRFHACRVVRSREPWNRGTQFPGYFLVARRGCVQVEVATQGKILRRTLRFGVARCT